MNTRLDDATKNALIRQHLKADVNRFNEAASVTGFGALDEPARVRYDNERSAELIRANLVVREYVRPTRTDVLKSLDAVESMAYSFLEEGTCFGDIESAFERVRSALEIRTKPSFAQSVFDARAAWNGCDEDTAGV